MRFMMMILIITLIAWLAGCTNQANEEHADGSAKDGISLLASQTSQAPESTPETTEITEFSKEDNSIRAIAAHKDGQLIIQPQSHGHAATLGAPSCYGLESDISWTGDYEAVWEPASGAASSKVMTFPSDFEIIQPTEAAVNLQMVTIGDTDLYTYYPRYTDCHALDIYFFGVKDGEAFPVSLELEAGKRFTGFVQHPHYPLQVTDDEIVITGGEGAGQEFINMYHFNYDGKQHALILQKTDQVKREALMNQNADPSDK